MKPGHLADHRDGLPSRTRTPVSIRPGDSAIKGPHQIAPGGPDPTDFHAPESLPPASALSADIVHPWDPGAVAGLIAGVLAQAGLVVSCWKPGRPQQGRLAAILKVARLPAIVLARRRQRHRRRERQHARRATLGGGPTVNWTGPADAGMGTRWLAEDSGSRRRDAGIRRSHRRVFERLGSTSECSDLNGPTRMRRREAFGLVVQDPGPKRRPRLTRRIPPGTWVS